MKIAILSCNTGGGHNAAAAALAEEMSARGHESRTYNTLDFLPKGAADLISRGHDFAYRYAPKLYGAGYRMEEKRPSPLLYENSIRGIGPLYEALVDLGADAAICVHVFPAMMMTELRCGYVIAGLAATEVEGVDSLGGNITNEIVSKLGMKNLSKGVKVTVEESSVLVDITLNLKYGTQIPAVSAKVQDKVKSAIETMTGLSVTEVNIKVASVNVEN